MKLKGTIARDASGNAFIRTKFIAMGITSKEETDVPVGDILEEYSGKEVEIRIQEMKDGRAVLDKNEVLDAIHDQVKDARLLRERLLADEFRPGYHFVIPDDVGLPGDPNGAFFANGRYHLMYLYDRRDVGFCWGHISSHDLVHWRHHPDAIGPSDDDDGCFSGGVFLDDDGTAYISYWKLWNDKGIGIARSKGPDYDTWEKLPGTAIPATKFGIWETRGSDGQEKILACADPSNIWKKDGAYYMEAGNLAVLNEYGRDPKSPRHAGMRGDWVDLFRSLDLNRWEHVRRFYERDQDDKWTDASEDDMCPSFLPLPSSPGGGAPSGKYLQLFIAHNRGCQYYIGEYKKEEDIFVPEVHGRMSWIDNTFFAPEALIDGKGRQVMWAWLLDDPGDRRAALQRGWSGVYGLPRVLWLGEDGTLRMAVPPELRVLRCNEQSWPKESLGAGKKKSLSITSGLSCEIEMTVNPKAASRVGLLVRASAGEEEMTGLYYDAGEGCIVFDARKSSLSGTGRPVLEKAPFKLQPSEKLHLRVFIDKCVVEVFANDRQAITRRVYPTRTDSKGVYLFCNGDDAEFTGITSWELAPSNPW